MQNEIHAALSAVFSAALIEVTEQGGHYTVRIVDQSMEGLSAVKRQQSVYAPLAEMIADGRVHAVNIQAFSPTEVDS